MACTSCNKTTSVGNSCTSTSNCYDNSSCNSCCECAQDPCNTSCGCDVEAATECVRYTGIAPNLITKHHDDHCLDLFAGLPPRHRSRTRTPSISFTAIANFLHTQLRKRCDKLRRAHDSVFSHYRHLQLLFRQFQPHFFASYIDIHHAAQQGTKQ